MNFNSKETYLAARQEWTDNYNELSKEIRVARQAYRDAQRGYALDPKSYYSGAHLVVINTLREYENRKAEATTAINALQKAKKEAHLQWKEKHTVSST